MTEQRLPLLRSKIYKTDTFASPVVVVPKINLPNFVPATHAESLLQQLELIEKQAKERSEQRDPEASREIIAVHPTLGFKLVPSSLGDAAHDVRVVGEDPVTGVVLLDSPSPQLSGLRDKIAAFADDSKANTKDGIITSRANEKAIAPILKIVLSELQERAGASFEEDNPEGGRPYWFEVSCRGGYRRPDVENTNSRTQMKRQLTKLELSSWFEEFKEPSQICFLLHLTLENLRALVQATDCILEVDLAPPNLRDWRLLNEMPKYIELKNFKLVPPSKSAPRLVIIDSGIATGHPLLKGAILSATSVVPDVESGVDTAGHGTRMAGICLYPDVGAVVESGSASPGHWLQSVRFVVEEGKGTAEDTDQNRRLWPKMTQDAVTSAEIADPTSYNRVFALAVSRRMKTSKPIYTRWSQALNQLAYREGKGRLIAVCVGNANDENWLALENDYPFGQLGEKLHEPAQAANVLTVGAYTMRDRIPPEPAYSEVLPVAPSGGISPFTSTGIAQASWPIKPEVVFEGGNMGISGGAHPLPDGSIETLSALTTGHQILTSPLSTLSMTSEATARAARLAAEIWAVEPKLRPETVRGLIVHAASWTKVMKTQFTGLDDRLMACGYGVPDEALAMECAADRATIVVEDELVNSDSEEVLKKDPPKRQGTKTTEPKKVRKEKLFRLPVPNEIIESGDLDVELRVTLSYFSKTKLYRRKVSHGLNLRWDMQGPQESENEFLDRINNLCRPLGSGKTRPRQYTSQGYRWEIGEERRNRGTVQSERWCGKASFLAGNKLIAVYPALGWWDAFKETKREALRFSLIVTIIAPGIYSMIEPKIEKLVEV
jgi:hypothetical protein